jgi:4-carboxymuconolactone decarboxylase
MHDTYRRQVSIFGAEAVEKRMSALGEFGAPLQQIINAYAYGDIWSRPGSSAKYAA